MAFRFRIIPRNEDFYDQFSTLATELRVGAGMLEEMLAHEPVIWDKADEIKEVEHKCDHLTHQIIQRLNSTFVTPIDREDIHALAKSLDDVMDAIDASAKVVRLYKIKYGPIRSARAGAHRDVERRPGAAVAPGAGEAHGRCASAPSRSIGSRTRPIGSTKGRSGGCSTTRTIP